jgi:hypothetical protein
MAPPTIGLTHITYQLDYPEARKVLKDLQAAPVDKLPIDEEWITVPAAVGDAHVRIIKPQGADGVLPVILLGGDMTAALTLMAKERGDVQFVHAGIYYPVTDAAMDTGSYDEFAEGPYLTRKAMEWFWDAYTTSCCSIP